MAVTVKDVAKLAGVSISTVSRVINDSKPVTDEVKQRVIDELNELSERTSKLVKFTLSEKFSALSKNM